MKIVVTGGGGFLGSHIVEQLLRRGDEVTVLGRGQYPRLLGLGARVTNADICDEAAVHSCLTGAEIVFHVAAKPGIWGSWRSFYEPNVVGTRNVIKACRANGVPKLVYTSSPSVVFSNRPHLGANESLPYPSKFESFYPQTKSIAEREILAANSSSLLTVALRPHLIWGPRDTHILPRLIARAQAGRLIQVGDGSNKVDLTYVEDAARAHLLAADALKPGSLVAGSVYFISQDEPVHFWSWVNEILVRLELPKVKRRISLRTGRAIGSVLELTYRLMRLRGEPRLTRFLASELALDHYYDISRAKKELGYTPAYTMAQAMEKTVAYLLDTRDSWAA